MRHLFHDQAALRRRLGDRRAGIALLAIILCGASGCAPAMLATPARLERFPREPLPAPVSVATAENTATAPESGPLPYAFQAQAEITEENLTPMVARTPNALPKKIPAKLPRTDDIAKAAAPLSVEDPNSLLKAPGPRADNRLMTLLEKDLEKAIETPRRRLEFSKQVSNDPKVRYFIEHFSSKRGKPYFEKILARSGKYIPMIARVLNEEGLPEELAYLALIESAFLPEATSSQGAAGLWQFVPSTARLYGLRIDTWLDERRDPEKATRAAAAYLKDLHSFFGRWYLATAAYNAGPGAIDRAMQQSGARDFWTLTRKAQLSEETRNFVPKFVAVALIATNPEKYGFTDLQYEAPLEYEEVEIRRSLRMGVLAEMADTEVATIRALNPALSTNSTPPGDGAFKVKLPVGKTEIFAKAYDASNHKSMELAQPVTHQVKRGETLTSIARRYGQEVGALMRLNGLTSARLYAGQQLKVMIRNLSGRLQ
jgi:membrane-bound lytic murein transglycosylase D